MALGDYVKTAYANGTTPAVNATNLNNIEDKVYELDRTVIKCGTYTPTLYNGTNVAASTAYLCRYMQVGACVTVSGRVDIDLTSATTASELRMELPIASDFTAVTQCSGTALSESIGGGWAIKGDPTNDRASFVSNTIAGTANYAFYFVFNYRIL